MNNDAVKELINATYTWFNQIADPKMVLRQTDLERYFTPEFIMQTNDEIITEGYDSLLSHFEEFRESGSIFKVQLPLQEVIISDDKEKCVVRYNIDKMSPHDRENHNIKVIAIWHISQDDRLNRMNEVVYFK